jgi:cyclopropane fatty-acyl-phospholipid synthase-like methyltransferase
MKQHTWLLDEMTHAGEEHLDQAHVDIYDWKSATDPSEDVEIFRAFGIDSTSTLVDFGAGTGTFALAIAPYCGRVVAVDVSHPMLASLRWKIEEMGVDNIDIVQAGFLSYEHQADPPDFLYSRNALHHLPDFWKVIALRRMYDLLNSGGMMRLHDLVYSFEPEETEEVFAKWLMGKPERPEDGYTREDLETHIWTEYSTFSWLFEPMLERVGFEIQSAEHRGGTYAAYTCVKR